MIYIVVPLENYHRRTSSGAGRPIEAPDAETAIFLARKAGLDEWLRETDRIADGWYTAEWSNEKAEYVHPFFYQFEYSIVI